MPLGLIGHKKGMTRVYTAEGASVPATIVEALPNRITQIKTVKTDGYNAIQVTEGKVKNSRISKPSAGHFAKAGVSAGKHVGEFRIYDNELELLKDKATNTEILVSLFKNGQKVDVTGVMKGKGFAGVIKRHNFSSQDASHGNSLSHRVPGSMGQRTSPGRVFKGKKLPGHMGNVQRTVQSLEVMDIDVDNNLLIIKGSVPGPNGGKVVVKPTARQKR